MKIENNSGMLSIILGQSSALETYYLISPNSTFFPKRFFFPKRQLDSNFYWGLESFGVWLNVFLYTLYMG